MKEALQYDKKIRVAISGIIMLIAASNWNMLTCQSVNQSQDIYIINKGSDSELDLKEFAAIHSDRAGKSTGDNINREHFFSLSDFDVDLDINYYWVKMRIRSDLTHESDWRLSLFEGWCEEVDVYHRPVNSGNEWQIQKAGYARNLHELDLSTHAFQNTRKTPDAISITFKPGEEKEFLIRYTRKMRYYLFISPKLVPMIGAANDLIDQSRRSFYIIAVMCIFLALAIYHLIVFIIVRDTAYLFYALYSGSVVFASTIMDRYALLNYQIFYSSSPNIQPWVFNLIGPATIIFYILFTRSYLRTKERFPKLDIALLLLVALNLISTIISNINFVITGRQYVPGLPFEAQVVLLAVAFAVLLISIWKERDMIDKFYLLAVGITLAVLVPEYVKILLNFNSPAPDIETEIPVNSMQIAVLLELFIFSIGLAYRTRMVAVEKNRVEELNRLKSGFFANISHEFRTPLTLIMGPLDQLSKKLTAPEDTRIISLAKKNAKNMLQLVNQVLELSKLENNNVHLKASFLDIIPFLKGIFYSFESWAKQKEINQIFHSDHQSIEMYFDPEKMETIFSNLLSNAFKFSENGGEIKLMVSIEKKSVIIKLVDKGKGIPFSDIPHIFDRFYQVESENSDYESGSGIGLALVKELVQIHHGKINVASAINRGSKFQLSFPIGKEHLSAEQIMPNDINPKQGRRENLDQNHEIFDNSDIPGGPGMPNEEALSILLIEDNLDVRAFIKSQLSREFLIEESGDGRAGIKKAIALSPDLIICDVMMPLQNGYEVCAVLKKDIRTSHIPIILLTAKAAQEEKLEGLESGADDYLVKPFDSTELRVRIKNLIDLRKQLRTRFSSSNQIRPSEVSTNSMDQEFMMKITSVVEQNMESENLGVNFLARELGISSTQLNRKLRSLIDQSTNQFITTVKLQRAASLLKSETGTVSEIAYKTGFNSATYFATVFKNHFKVSPADFKSGQTVVKDV